MKKDEIRAMLEAKARREEADNLAREEKIRRLSKGMITVCKHGGAYKHKQVLRSSQSRNYAGDSTISARLKDEATLLTKSLSKIMGDSPERLKNLSNGNGAKVSQRTIKKAQSLQSTIRELKSTSKELLEGHHEPLSPIIGKPRLIKKRKELGHEGAYGISAYSGSAKALDVTMGV